MPRFIAIIPDSPSPRAQQRIQRLQRLDPGFCALSSARDADTLTAEAVIFLDDGTCDIGEKFRVRLWFDDGDPRKSVGPRAIEEAIERGASSVFGNLRSAWESQALHIWATRDVCRRPWDTVLELTNRVDDQIGLLLRDAADRLDGKGSVPVFSPQRAAGPGAATNLRQRLRDRRFLLHKITPALRWLSREKMRKVLLWHDPPADIVDATLTALARIGPFHSLGETVELMRAGKSLSPGFVVTFDDGRKGNLDLLDVLEKHGCVATFFIVTGLVDTGRATWTYNPDKDKALAARHRWLKTLSFAEQRRVNDEAESAASWPLRGRFSLTSSEIRSIAARGHQIGVHTENHPYMTQLASAEMEREVLESHRRLKELLGDPSLPLHLAYPYGDHNRTVVDTMGKAGVCSAVTTNSGATQNAPSLLEIPRYTLADKDYSELAVLKTRPWFDRLRSTRLGTD